MSKKRDQYVETMKTQLDEMNGRMDDLDAKAKDVKTDVRDAYKAEVKKVRALSASAVAKLDELKTSGEESWEAMVAEMEKIRDAFTHSFNYFKSQV